MKKILFSVALLLSVLNCRAQQSYTQVQDSLMQHLDKALIPTGILYDRVYPWASLTHINSGTDTIDYDYAKQAWHELELASYVLTDDMHTLESIKESIRQNTAEGKGISIGYIDIAFNTMDSNALINGALILGADSLWYDGGSTTTKRVWLFWKKTVTTYGEGHAWLCDGYEAKGTNCGQRFMYHMNWGWSGRFNDWFNEANWNPSTFNYQFNRRYIKNIYP